jgi:hypothetical protein
MIYGSEIVKYRNELGNAIQTGKLVQQLQAFLNSAKFEPWSEERRRHVEAFLAAMK